MYVITMLNSDHAISNRDKLFLAFDQDTGGIAVWKHSLNGAKIFQSQEEAAGVIFSKNFMECTILPDGRSFPPRLIQIGLGLSNTNRTGQGYLCIEKLSLEVVRPLMIEAQLETPALDKPENIRAEIQKLQEQLKLAEKYPTGKTIGMLIKEQMLDD